MSTSEPISGPFCTDIWIARIQNLQSHLRIIARDLEDSNPRLALQAKSGIAEADRYLAEPDWDACSLEERTAQ